MSINRNIVLLLSVFLLLSKLTEGQYYYQDIIKTERANKNYQRQIENKVAQIQVIGVDADKQVIPDFQYVETFSSTPPKTEREMGSSASGKSYFISYFNKENQIIHTVDSTTSNIEHTFIYYDSTRHLIDSLFFKSYSPQPPGKRSFLDPTPEVVTETHLYHYDKRGHPTEMIRKKGNRIYSTIRFKTDSTGRVEKESTEDSQEPIYYYKYEGTYLSDIFHYTFQRNKIRPDYQFRYNDQEQLTDEIIVMANTSNFLEWKYTYENRGLIAKQTGFNKEGTLQATLVFKYLFEEGKDGF